MNEKCSLELFCHVHSLDNDTISSAHIGVKSCSKFGGMPVLSPECVTYKEVTWHCERLIRELGQIADEAKNVFDR